ncbi:hypothetical protein DW1_1111 [Proteiniborus sp. DW1]|uniref:hypothetical protein n=1 Tax=Proteiniborus sp. DW1 TaxID=1889883 RepID=UPI00092DFCDC|nr:hypothetical protein [Proteiniborus sp. DW1]SCG82684.1 hypothetical protein DW1_1111 [Proteiniborus sp. DW1]
MNIKLNWLHIKHFKGIKDFKLDAKGKNVSVFADNGKGKTTLIDGFQWLLFGKDSNDKTDFTVKPQDELGQDIHHLQTEVEAELLVDGQPLRLKKMQEEDWQTPRGQAKPKLKGNKSYYWYNEVPVKAGEYKEKIDGLINENIFKMITNPLFFNTKLKWEERRKILLEICGDATQEQVIASDKSLAKLTEILNGRSIDDYKSVLADKLKGLKKERDDIPPRIDELTLSLPQEEPDYSATEKELQSHKETLQGIELLLTNATTKANEHNKKFQDLYKLKTQLEKVKTRIASSAGANKSKLIQEKTELINGQIILQGNILNLKNQIESCQRNIDYGEQELKRLREDWKTLNEKKSEIMAMEFDSIEHGVNTQCPTCGQALPEEEIKYKLAEMEINFDKNKQSELSQVIAKLNQNKDTGISTKAKVEQDKKDKELLERELAEKKLKLKEISATIAELDKEISKPSPEPDYSKDAEYIEISEKIIALQTELEKPVEDKSGELLQRKANIQAKIDECNKVLNNKDTVAKNKKRIEELKAEEKRVSALIAELEGHKFLLERFVVAKVNLLEDKINSQFKHVKFKLFEENITNDGIKETCIALVNTNGAYVKFEDGNLAGQINAGLDIINALCKFYNVQVPIFIDNRESVSEIMAINSQIINLIKPPTWDELDKTVQYRLAGVENCEQPSMLDMVNIEKAKKAWNDRNNTLRVEVQE